MNAFDYLRPTSLAEAIKMGARPEAAYLAGGTNLLDLMKGNIVKPGTIVDITHIQGLDSIEWQPDGGVRIGALVPNSDLAYDDRFARAYPAVAEALLSGASAQLRNAATVAGNILQRTRCQYFYDTASTCGRRVPGEGCGARGGITRTHAILGWSKACTATHPSDFCVPLAALDGIVEITGTNGTREIPVEGFHLLPGDKPHEETILKPGELVTALRLPGSATGFAARQRYVKVRERTSYAFAAVSCAAAMRIESGRIVDVRIALGGVAAKPWRAFEAEAAMKGRPAEKGAYEDAAATALADARAAGPDNAYKIELARRTVVRALILAAEGTPARMPALPASIFAHREAAHG